MRIIGYARVSTKEQNLDVQLKALKKAKCEKIFIDHGVSGAKASRPEWDMCKLYLQPGDKLVVFKLDRLGRSLINLLNIIKELNERNVEFKSLQNNIDTTTSTGRLMFHIMASFAEYERELIRERVQEGVDNAIANGKKFGRNPIEPIKVSQIKRLYKNGYKVSEIAAKVGVGTATIYRILKSKK